MTTVEILKAARELISKPENWTKFHTAEDEFGNGVPISSPFGRRYCAIGAVKKIGDPDFFAYYKLYDAAKEITGFPWVASYNDADETQHSNVLALYDRAIALAEKEAA